MGVVQAFKKFEQEDVGIVAGFLLTYFSPQLLGFAAGLFYVLVGVSAFGVSYFRKKDKHLQNYEME